MKLQNPIIPGPGTLATNGAVLRDTISGKIIPNYNASLFYQEYDGEKTFDKAYSDVSDID